ncbi:MAG: 50S ribosomal protein L24 [Berkelbacteria bacterium GW2011_GWA2_38_9]|uniref:Large ribosomal subunit protein uL24 n=1 Tax=Berkelbacteria bacterium GW2011_GWA2_38_9 TaxID=1618334 RepID=A0A0G0L4E7_9BACT|nr:MAG: 50S ribosomal protein L24 [Berkelbacteria bacterium GW2011_GWA2_38_9]
MKLKVGDNVIMLIGKDRSKFGRIDKIFKEDNKVVVKGVNIVKKHQKKSQSKPQGGIIEKYMPVNASKVQILCPSCNKPTKVGYLISDNSKTRICRSCRGSLDAVHDAESVKTVTKKK